MKPNVPILARQEVSVLCDPYPGPHNWGSKLQDRGRHEEAEPLYRQGLEICHGLREPVA